MRELSQRDPRWAHIRLGTGNANNTTIGSHGCTITCLAMAAGLTPDVVNSLFIEHKVYSSGSNPNIVNLVNWQRIHLALPFLKFAPMGRKYVFNEAEVYKAVDQYGFCLVEVDFDGTPRSDDRHWVLFKPNRRQNDPWTGNETPTDKYHLKTGFAIIERTGQIPVEGPTVNYEQLGRAFEEILKRYGKGSVADFDSFLKEHVGENGQGGFLASERAENQRLRQQVKELMEQPNQPQPPTSTPNDTLPTTWQGKTITGIILDPRSS